jgi:isoleucyl-tRNA synthetase
MPYAQFHYPFCKNDTFKDNFPADFIAEGVDQTRGWFYSLLAISTIVSGKPAYKSCLSIELILDKEGQKMSKSKGNAVDPFTILNNQGADPLRWYLFTVSPPWLPTRFDSEGIQEVLRKFFGTLINTYSFFILYANIDNFSYDDNIIPFEKRPEIDRWLISTLNSLVKRVSNNLSRYDITRAAREIQDFVIDDLSNWYVRRNRRRFWKSELSEEKVAAYQTLFEALLTLSKLIAPFAPFLAEDIYCNLNSSCAEENESVHLASYPSPQEKRFQYIDDSLQDRMNIARSVVTIARSLRNEANIRVRQPLRKTIIVTDKKNNVGIRQLEKLILQEINVRVLEFADDSEKLMVKRAKPVFKTLGPKLGSHVNQIADRIKQFSPEEIDQLQKGRKICITLGQKFQAEVELEDIEIYTEVIEGFVIQSNENLTVALDINLDEELKIEGLAREFVNRVQNMRKEADFLVTDRILLYVKSEPVIRKAIKNKYEYICGEVLAVSMIDRFGKGEFYREWEIENEKVQIGIERTNCN